MTQDKVSVSGEVSKFFDGAIRNIRSKDLKYSNYFGHVMSYDGQIIETTSLPGIIGSYCAIYTNEGAKVSGEIVAVKQDKVVVLPYEDNLDIRVGDLVLLLQPQQEVEVGVGLLGRVIDGLGEPLDGLGPIKFSTKIDLNGSRINPFAHTP